MPAIVQTALSNAVLVTAVTPLVWSIGRLARRPVLAHSLWLIVLFKLITPPLWTWGVQLPQPARTAVETKPISTRVASVATVEVRSVEAPAEFARPAAQDGTISTALVPGVSLPAASESPVRTEPINWRAMAVPCLVIIWGVGAVLCLCVAMFRVVRFTRALGWATPASAAVQSRADALARSVGLERSPMVQFIPGPLCPMLWPIGNSARLLLPAALWDRLDSVQRDTVLLHELAHWARRDHWVRWVELLATSLYWWLPACWLARKELRRAEEQCCDAWVLWAMPGTFQNYAHALLQTVEFVSVRADRPSALSSAPALASGMGQFSDLKGRLTMLKYGNVSRALSFGGMVLVFGLGALLLPVSPTIGQDAPQPAPAADQPRPTAAVEAPPATTDPQNSQPNPMLSKESHLDRSVYEKLGQMNLLPAQDATDAEYIRRLYLDLAGMPPSADRVRQFVDDPAPSAEKRKVLLEKLLAGTAGGAQDRALRESQLRIDELVRQLEQANARIAALKAQADAQAKQGGVSLTKQPFFGGAFETRSEPQSSPKGLASPNGTKLDATPPVDPGQAFGQPGATGGSGFGRTGSSLPPGTTGMGRANSGVGSATTLRDQNRSGDYQGQVNAGRVWGYRSGDPAERLDRLEAELKVMLKEIDSLRAEQQGARGMAPPPADSAPNRP